jgi:tetratricopeptide (TPR) repeat protein
MIFRLTRLRARYFPGPWIFMLLLAGGLAGCATPPLQSARENFYLGRLAPAETNLAAIPIDDKDAVLYLMERGMIRQARQEYEASCLDWRKAADLDAVLETYSISQGATSLLVNDRVLSFRGAPFERTLLYAFLAKNYLALQNWDYAAICARNIIRRLDNLDGFPDIPYGRYLAGFCLEMIDDEGNAAIQYKTIAKLLPDLTVDEDTGLLYARGQPEARAPQTDKAWQHELVCFVLSGRIPAGDRQGFLPETGAAPHAEIYWQERYLGRSFPLANTAELLAATQKRTMMIELAKTTTRLAVKIGISEAVKQQNEALGFLTELLLFSLEQPDTRRWETLPLWLEVARVPCPPDLDEFNVVFPNGQKLPVKPVGRRGRIYVAFCRDLPQ